MSADKYQGGITHGIAGAISAGAWPEEIPGLGSKHGGQPMAQCERCPKGTHPAKASTFVSYGRVFLCKGHAIEASGRTA